MIASFEGINSVSYLFKNNLGGRLCCTKSPCIPLMQLNMLRHRLMQHFTKVWVNGERYVDDHVSFIGINARMSGS